MLLNLDNVIFCEPQTQMGKYKRVKLPVPEEFGGGVVTGFGYEDTVRKLIDRVRGKISAYSDRPTFEACWEQWITIKIGEKKSAGTIANYKWISEKHILPFFGKIPIDKVTPDDIQRFYNSINSYSASISNQCKAVLCGIFDRAARLGLIDRNIMLYKYERSTKKGNKVVLQDSDLLNIVDNLAKLEGKDHIYACFLCFTALRRGEILGLKWSDIDFENDLISVQCNVIFPNGSNDPVVTIPKDGSSGVVHLQSELKKDLVSCHGRSYILPYSDDEPDRPMTRSMFTKMWRRISKVLELKGATSHSFRATYVTMMNAHCDHVDPKVLQGALRHKTPDLALKIYTKENASKTLKAEVEYDDWLSSQLKHTP